MIIKRPQDKIIKILLLLISLIIYSNAYNEYKHRIKRHVVFSKSSKFFFRLNGKDNVLNHTDLFAHGWAIRVNWELPESIPKRYKFFKRDVHSEIENISNKFAFQGFSCVIKYICEMVMKINSDGFCGIFCQIGHIIKRSNGIEANYFRNLLNKCDYYTGICPYYAEYG